MIKIILLIIILMMIMMMMLIMLLMMMLIILILAQCTLLFVETTKLSFFYFVLKAGRIALVNHVIIISFLFFFHLELEAYSSIISAFRAQGELSRSVDLFVL